MSVQFDCREGIQTVEYQVNPSVSGSNWLVDDGAVYPCFLVDPFRVELIEVDAWVFQPARMSTEISRLVGRRTCY